MKKEKPEYYWCKTCENAKPIIEFRTSNKSLCLQCETILNAEKHKLKREQEIPVQIHKQPNVYESESQRKDTFEFLESIGWTFNPINNIWYKDEFGKDKDGNWSILKVKPPKHQPQPRTRQKWNYDESIHQIVLRDKTVPQSLIIDIQKYYFTEEKTEYQTTLKFPQTDLKTIKTIINNTYRLLKK